MKNVYFTIYVFFMLFLWSIADNHTTLYFKPINMEKMRYYMKLLKVMT